MRVPRAEGGAGTSRAEGGARRSCAGPLCDGIFPSKASGWRQGVDAGGMDAINCVPPGWGTGRDEREGLVIRCRGSRAYSASTFSYSATISAAGAFVTSETTTVTTSASRKPGASS